MEFKPDLVLVKTPQGVNATRSGEGLSSKSLAVLKLFDGIKPIAALKQVCLGASISETEFHTALKELQQFEYLRVLDTATAAGADAKNRASAEAERRMLQTLDFTAEIDAQAQIVAVPATPAVSVSPRPAPAAAKATSMPVAPVDVEVRAREEKAALLKLEAEIRQKLLVALQPRVEEELRTRLRPRLEEELRPKLIAALRPGLEAEVRTALTQELTPRIELELKARFAKTMAAQKAADQQAAKTEPNLAAAAPVAVVDNAFERVLASMNIPVFSVDKAGMCSYVSPAWTQFSGHATVDTVGKYLVDFFAEADRRAIAALLTGIAGGTALRFEQQGALTRRESEPLWVEINAAPLYSASGEPMGVCGAIRDASESRRIVDQAEADGVRLLLLVDQIDTGVVLEDGDGNIQQVNPALCTLLALDAAPYSLEGMAVTELLERVSKGFIAPEGFLRRVAEIRGVGEDSKSESFVMTDGRVIEQDYLAVTVGSNNVGRLWLFRETRRVQARTTP